MNFPGGGGRWHPIFDFPCIFYYCAVLKFQRAPLFTAIAHISPATFSFFTGTENTHTRPIRITGASPNTTPLSGPFNSLRRASRVCACAAARFEATGPWP